MKKTASLLLITALLTASLNGCSGKAASPTAAEALADETTVRVGALKGPTSMGLVSLIENSDNGNSASQYDFTMVTAADELLGKVVSGDLDIALIPANVASVLYNRTGGGISVIDINTLGVLYIVSSDESIQGIADLKGRTVSLTGKGNTPEFIMNYLLDANDLTEDDVTLEFKSEATEVAVLLKEHPNSVGMLPQPFVTVATSQNEDLKIVLDCTEEWDKLQGEDGSQLVTGVTIVRNDFLEDHKELVDQFLADHAASTVFALTNPAETSVLIAKAGIIENASVALTALPYCNIVCLTGEGMKNALEGYLAVLYGQDPASIGGNLPAEDFYYLP